MASSRTALTLARRAAGVGSRWASSTRLAPAASVSVSVPASAARIGRSRGFVSSVRRAQEQVGGEASAQESFSSGSSAPPPPPPPSSSTPSSSQGAPAGSSPPSHDGAETMTESDAPESNEVEFDPETAFPAPPIPTTFEELRFFQPPESPPQTHGIHVATLSLQTYGPTLHNLENYSDFALRVLGALGIPHSGVARLPTRTSLWTVPKSPFVHKKAQENFERRTHRRTIKMWDAAPEVVEVALAFLRTHAMAEVDVKVQLMKYYGLPSFSDDKDSRKDAQQPRLEEQEAAAPASDDAASSPPASASTAPAQDAPSQVQPPS